MKQLTRVGLQALLTFTASGKIFAVPPGNPFVANAEDIRWAPSALASGAQEAALGPSDQRLHRWPPGAETAWQQRPMLWDVVLISGRLTVSIASRPPRTIDQLSYVKIPSGVRHRLRCEGQESCVMLGFSGQSEPPQTDHANDSTNQTSDASPADDALFVDIAAAQWSPAPPPDGVEIGLLERQGRRAPWLPLIYPSAYFAYRLRLGTRLPLNHAWADSRGFMLHGTAAIDVGDGDRKLPAGSMFSLSGKVGWLECKDAPCILLATSRPPSWRGQ